MPLPARPINVNPNELIESAWGNSVANYANALPRGVLAYVEVIAAQTGISTTPVDLNGLTTGTVAVPAGRRIEVACGLTFTKAGADTAHWASLELWDQTGTVQVGFASVPAPGWALMALSRTFLLAAGSYSWKLRASTGGGFLNTQAAPNAPAWLRVTDIGPA